MSGRPTLKRDLEATLSDGDNARTDGITKKVKPVGADPLSIYPSGWIGSGRSNTSSETSFIDGATKDLSLSSTGRTDSPQLNVSFTLPLPRLHGKSLDQAHLSSFSQRASHIDEAKADTGDAALDKGVCFGMLKNVQIKFYQSQVKPRIPTEEYVARADKGLVTLALDFDLERCTVQTTDGVALARVNTKTALAMRSLALHQKVSFKGVASRAELDQKLAQTTLTRNPNPAQFTWPLNIHVFGDRSVADTVARELSKLRLFLQHPNPFTPGTVYENPQYLIVPGASLPNGTVLAPLAAELLRPETERAVSAEEFDDEEQNLTRLMNTLPRHDYLQEIDIDSSIKTVLLKHQKEAVDFALQRESLETAKPKGLWIPCGTNDLGYQHSITGAKSPRQIDALGGILADDMGLGKTLSMIATIVSTSSRAEKSASSQQNKSTIPTLRRPVKSTLVLVPTELILNGWIDQIKKHVVPGTLKWYKYHGPNRSLAPSSSLPFDIVFSTYGTVTSDFSRGGGVLDCFHWYRVIIDEAHVIRNSSTKTFKAVRSLSAVIRWCLSGTPIQNSLGDLESLLQFLRVPLLEERATFRRFLSGNQLNNGRRNPNYENIRLLLGSICLRRSRSIMMPLEPTEIEQQPELTVVERRAYDKIETACGRSIEAAVSQRREKRGNRIILEKILELRMFCNMGLSTIATTHDHAPERQLDEYVSLLQQSGEAVCSKCELDIFSPDDVGRIDKKGFAVCKDCCHGILKSSPEKIPPINADDVEASEKTENEEMLSIPMDLDTTGLPYHPSKLIALLKNIKAYYTDDKSIVFSFWKRSLDLVEQLFLEQNIVFVRVDGGLSQSQREKALAEFQDSSSIRVLLITLGTGAVGINNLTVANRIHILEPQWNPFIESQAIGRVQRLDQSKKVTVIRYIVKGTFEESVRHRQITKIQLALKGGLQASEESSGGQRWNAQLRALGHIIKSSEPRMP